jgi:hypothetical protein
MRLLFWSARELGVFAISPSFEEWFVNFIAHFIGVYERTAPDFAVESCLWSTKEENILAYRANGNRMPSDVLGNDGNGVSYRMALKALE